MESIHFNRLSDGSSINGKISVTGDFYIAGKIKGDIILENKGLILIEPTGEVQGDISCLDLQILGKVSGNIRANGQVTIKSSGHIVGTIQAKGIKVFPGAIIESHLEVEENF